MIIRNRCLPGDKRYSGHPLCYCSSLPGSTCDFCSGLRQGTVDDFQQLVGQRVYYTGDRANPDGWAVVVKVTWDDKWGYGAEIFMQDICGPRKFNAIHVCSFQGIGRRFQTEGDWKRERRQKVTEFLATWPF